jgi:hypothetical protein
MASPDMTRNREYARVVAGTEVLALGCNPGGYYVMTASGSAYAGSTDATLPAPTFLAATVEGTVLRGYLYQPSPNADIDVPPQTTTTTTTAITAAATVVHAGWTGGVGSESNTAIGQVLVFNSSLDLGTLEILARSTTPASFLSDPRIVFSAGIGTDIEGTTATALAATGSFQQLAVSPGRLELTSDLTAILTPAQEAYAYRLALPLGTGYGVGSRVEINGDNNLHAVEATSSGLETFLYFN